MGFPPGWLSPREASLAQAGGARLRTTSLASRVMSIEPCRSFEIGQISLAFWAAARNASSVAPGTFALTVRCTSVMVKPLPSFAPVTTAVVRISSAVSSAAPSTPESCIE